MEAVPIPIVIDNDAGVHDSNGNNVVVNEAKRFDSPGSDSKVLVGSHLLFLADSSQLSIRSTSTNAKTQCTGSTIDNAIELSDNDAEDEVEVRGLYKLYLFTAI